MAQNTKVVVVGGGAVGLCVAYALNKRGMRVTVVDKGEIGVGASAGNAGMIVPSHVVPLSAPGVVAKGLRWALKQDSPFRIKPRMDWAFVKWLWRFRKSATHAHMHHAIPILRDLSLASVELFDAYVEGGLRPFGWGHSGLWMLFNSEKGRKENLDMADLAQEAGLDVEVHDAAGVCTIDPNQTAPLTGGVLYRQDAVIDPKAFMQALAHHLRDQGVTLLEQTAVTGFAQEGDQIRAAETSQGDIEAGEVVLAAGAWMPTVSRQLGLNMPVEAAKGYSVTLETEQSLPEIPAILSEAKVTVTPLGQKRMRFAGTLELAGLDASVDARRARSILRAVPHYIPDFDADAFDPSAMWSGFRPCSPDGLPMIGRVDDWANLSVATGHGMMGITLAPITGELIAQQLAGEALPDWFDALRLSRF